MKRRKAPKQNPLKARLEAFARNLEAYTKANEKLIDNINKHIENK